jgi:hypothetical protein
MWPAFLNKNVYSRKIKAVVPERKARRTWASMMDQFI